jgi:beta-glucosidase
VAWLSHFMGFHAPGLRDIRATARAMHHVCWPMGAVERHARWGMGTWDRLNFEYALPADDSPEAAAAAARWDGIFNRWFIEGITGANPIRPRFWKGWPPTCPQAGRTTWRTIAQPLDWLGVNYYTRT